MLILIDDSWVVGDVNGDKLETSVGTFSISGNITKSIKVPDNYEYTPTGLYDLNNIYELKLESGWYII
jgi:hypothetical protein